MRYSRVGKEGFFNLQKILQLKIQQTVENFEKFSTKFVELLILSFFKIFPQCPDFWIFYENFLIIKSKTFPNSVFQAAQAAEIPVVVTGCVPQGAPKDKFIKGLSTVGVQQIDRVVEVVEETLKGNTVKLMGPKVISKHTWVIRNEKKTILKMKRHFLWGMRKQNEAKNVSDSPLLYKIFYSERIFCNNCIEIWGKACGWRRFEFAKNPSQSVR